MKKLRRSRPTIRHQVSQNHRNVVDQMSPYVSAASLYQAGHLLQMSLFADLADSSSLWTKGIQLTHSYKFQVTSALNLFSTARGQKSKKKTTTNDLDHEICCSFITNSIFSINRQITFQINMCFTSIWLEILQR